MSLRVLREKLINSNCDANAFLDSFNLEKNDIVCIAEMPMPAKGEDVSRKHRHTVIYTNSVNEVSLADFNKLTTREQSSFKFDSEFLTDDEKSRVQLKRQKTSESIESMPNSWGQVAHVLVEEVDK